MEYIYTLQGTNISHLGKRKIVFKSALGGDMLVPRIVYIYIYTYIYIFLIIFTSHYFIFDSGGLTAVGVI